MFASVDNMNKQEKKAVINNNSENKNNNVEALKALSLAEIGVDSSSRSALSEQYALWVKVLLQNWRQGTVGCKARGEVAYTNKKPWKQKGTGRARAGSARSPLWRGGGVVFGPQARVKTLKINKKNKKQVLAAIVCDYATKNMVYSLDWSLQQEKPSTALAYKVFEKSNLLNKKVTLFLDRNDIGHWMSVRNLKNIQVLSFDDVNAYELSLGNCIVVLKKDNETFKDMVKQWN